MMSPLKLLLLCYNVALFYFSIVPSKLIESTPMAGEFLIGAGKFSEGGIVHYFAMLVLFGIWFFNIRDRYKSLLATILTGAILELIQLTLPWRSFSPLDILWNSAGGLTGHVIISVIIK